MGWPRASTKHWAGGHSHPEVRRRVSRTREVENQETRALAATCKKRLQERGTSGHGVQENQAEETCEQTSSITKDLSKNR